MNPRQTGATSMKILFKTGGMLVEHLPTGGSGGSAELEVADDATPLDVMRQLRMPLDDNYLISLNGEVVVTSERSSRGLKEGDRLAIMPPLKGG